MTKIGVGILGLSARGGWASTAHVPALNALNEFYEIRGLTASNLATAEAAARLYDVPFYSADPEALVARPEIDLVVIAVKVPYHSEFVKTALAAGKMIYCEWPLGINAIEAEELTKLAAKRGVKAFIGLQARSGPSIRYLRDLVAQGYVGQVLSTTMTAWGGTPWGGTLPASLEYLIDRNSGGSMLSIPMGHSLDALTWILGEFKSLSSTMAIMRPIARISDRDTMHAVTTADQVAISGVLVSGAVAAVHYRGGVSRTPAFTWEINGTLGDLVITGNSGHLQYGMISIAGGTGKEPDLTTLVLPPEYQRVSIDPKSLGYTVAHAYRALLDDIRHGTEYVPTFANALLRHRMVAAIETAALSGIATEYANTPNDDCRN